MSLDFTWLAVPHYQRLLLNGVSTTLQLSLCGLVLALLVGVVGASLIHWRVRYLSPVLTTFVELFRNTPSLVQLFFLYFMLSEMGIYFLDAETGRRVPVFSGFTCAVLMLAMSNGAIAIEIIRSGLASIPKETVEAARSLGYSRWQLLIYVELPLSFRMTIPLMANNIVSLIKTTSQSALIAVPDLLYAANVIMSDTFRNAEVMILVWALYLGIVSICIQLIYVLHRRARIPGYGQ